METYTYQEQWFETPLAVIFIIAAALALLVLLFFLGRKLTLWYFKINKMVKMQEETRAFTMFLAKHQFPQQFDEFDARWQEYRNAPRKSKMQAPKP
jgi:hypothetical protein